MNAVAETHVRWLSELFDFYEGQRVEYEKRCDTEWSPDIEREMYRYASEARALKYAIELITGPKS